MNNFSKTITFPVNDEAEQVVLGRMMNSINCANLIFEQLEQSDFFAPLHRAIFHCGYILFSQDRAIDPTSICNQMQMTYPNINDTSTIFGLSSYYSNVNISIEQFIESLQTYSVKRKIINFSKEMLQEAANESYTSEGIKNKFLQDSDVIFKSLNEGTLKTGKELVTGNFKDSGKKFTDYYQAKQEQRAKGLNTMEGIPSGYPLLDYCLEGFNKKHFIIIGARAGVGKTTFLLNLIHRFMQRGKKVGFFSLEMGADQILEKLLCIMAGVNYKKMSRHELTGNEFQYLHEAAKNLEQKFGENLIIDDQPNLNLSQLSARAKRMVKSYGVDAIMIDYLSEVKGEGRFSNKQEEIQAVSKGIRAIAKNLNIPVICLAQLNRENEKAGRRPRKSDLRESGQIEADAYSILLLHRPEQEDPNNRPGIMELYVVKNRLGSESSFDFKFETETGLITEMGYLKMQNKEEESKIKKDLFTFKEGY